MPWYIVQPENAVPEGLPEKPYITAVVLVMLFLCLWASCTPQRTVVVVEEVAFVLNI